MARLSVTIVFTDIVSSTSIKTLLPGRDITERNEHYLAEILTPHRKRIEHDLATYGGREVNTEGDAYFLVFDDTAQAARWAISIQKSHKEYPISTPIGPLSVKIGMHFGAPLIDPKEPKDFVGHEVDYAARIASVAKGGQIVLSEAAAALVRNASITGIHLVPLGTTELKGIGIVPVFELLEFNQHFHSLKQDSSPNERSSENSDRNSKPILKKLASTKWTIAVPLLVIVFLLFLLLRRNTTEFSPPSVRQPAPPSIPHISQSGIKPPVADDLAKTTILPSVPERVEGLNRDFLARPKAELSPGSSPVPPGLPKYDPAMMPGPRFSPRPLGPDPTNEMAIAPTPPPKRGAINIIKRGAGTGDIKATATSNGHAENSIETANEYNGNIDAQAGPLRDPGKETIAKSADKGFDLLLMSPLNDTDRIPVKGKNLMVVADINKLLHFRIFDDDGKVVVDTDEKKLTNQSLQIDNLKKQLEGLWPPHELSRGDRDRVIPLLKSISDYVTSKH